MVKLMRWVKEPFDIKDVVCNFITALIFITIIVCIIEYGGVVGKVFLTIVWLFLVWCCING